MSKKERRCPLEVNGNSLDVKVASMGDSITIGNNLQIQPNITHIASTNNEREGDLAKKPSMKINNIEDVKNNNLPITTEEKILYKTDIAKFIPDQTVRETMETKFPIDDINNKNSRQKEDNVSYKVYNDTLTSDQAVQVVKENSAWRKKIPRTFKNSRQRAKVGTREYPDGTNYVKNTKYSNKKTSKMEKDDVYKFYGDQLQENNGKKLRIYYNNCNGLEINQLIAKKMQQKKDRKAKKYIGCVKDATKAEKMLGKLSEWDVNTACIAETCVAWEQPASKKYLISSLNLWITMVVGLLHPH